MTRATALAVALALLVGCDDEELNPETQIEEPRLLAVKAEPPVLGITGSSTLSALVVDATGERTDVVVSYRACSPWRPVRSPDIDCAPGVSLPLPGGVLDVAQVAARFPPPSGAAGDLQDQLDSNDSECDADYGFVQLPIIAEASVDGVRLIAIKRVRVTTDDVAETRTNPSLQTVLLDQADAATRPALPGGAAYDFSVELESAALDPVCTEADPTVIALEPLDIQFYATAGTFSQASIDAELGLDGSSVIGTTTWDAPTDEDVVYLWLVVTDEEGGIHWSSQEFAIEP